ncbi:hypothetical protein CRUP_034032 [Coryphaenoides rupestris]|nr:hypothetical protein CRUP_034032 [Coryphaenoides rupestris]
MKHTGAPVFSKTLPPPPLQTQLNRKKRQKKEQAGRAKRWQKAGRGQKSLCEAQKCSRKGGERKESYHCQSPGPIVWHTYEIEKGQNIIKNFKRHSDGTFTSDFTHYLDKIKVKDFVEWLTSNTRVG